MTEDFGSGSTRCWDHEDCPHRWCGGELQQQDRFNVMCLECELVWTHVRYPPTHTEPPKDQLTDADGEVWAEKRAVATDGGSIRTDGGETGARQNSDSERSDDDDQVYFRTRDHPDHPTNPDGRSCVKCGDSAFIVTQHLETVEDGLNRVVTGDPLCHGCFMEGYPT